MAVLGARPFLTSLTNTYSKSSFGFRDSNPDSCAIPSVSLTSCGCLSSAAGECRERVSAGDGFGRVGVSGFNVGTEGRGRLVIVGRAGGSRPPAGARRPRITSPRRAPGEEQVQSDGPLINNDIRAPTVRLLDAEQNMVGVVSIQEALEKSRDAELDLVMISPDADPPVVRVMDYSKYRYELQKKKREAQKKAAASRQELKELKMRYNIDTHDYDVRLRAAQRFLRDGDKVKVVCQFKGREMDFKDLAFKLFAKFAEDIGELGVVESKMAIEGRAMNMTIGPNKAAAQKAQAQAQSATDKSKLKPQEAEKSEEPALFDMGFCDTSSNGSPS